MARTRTDALTEMPGGWPGRVAVTFTDTRLPRSVGFRVYLAPRAPAIGLPVRNHWYAILVGAGRHTPDVAVRTRPTLATPVMRAGLSLVKVAVPSRTSQAPGVIEIERLPGEPSKGEIDGVALGVQAEARHHCLAGHIVDVDIGA